MPVDLCCAVILKYMFVRRREEAQRTMSTLLYSQGRVDYLYPGTGAMERNKMRF